MFNQPLADTLAASRAVLLAGCGGGYDVLGAIPIALELLRAGKSISLGSLSFTRLDHVAGHDATDVPHLFRATRSACTEHDYCPEAWLSAWLSEEVGNEIPIWCFENVGPRPLRTAYEHVLRHDRIDTVVLIDGGVDSLLRGDETSLGTPSEDFSSLAVLDALEIERKVLACVGFGAEMPDGICHAQVLQRIAELTKAGAFLGVWPLLPGSDAQLRYAAAASYLQQHQSTQRGSHIHTVVAAAARGEFGVRGEDVWISPLASLYWFFSLAEVARQNLLLEHIREATTLWEVAATIEAFRKTLSVRPRSTIPL